MNAVATARHLRRHEYAAMPWRNGGGVTYEIAREPQAGVGFDWRLSLASIERGGPFSSFDGYRRVIALVSGSGCILHGIDAQPVRLAAPGDIALFSGAAPVTCELVAGPCSDLNLMVREPGQVAAAKHLLLSNDRYESAVAGLRSAVFCISGVVECVDSAGQRQIVLQQHDTLLLAAADAGNWRMRSGDSTRAQVIAFAW